MTNIIIGNAKLKNAGNIMDSKFAVSKICIFIK